MQLKAADNRHINKAIITMQNLDKDQQQVQSNAALCMVFAKAKKQTLI